MVLESVALLVAGLNGIGLFAVHVMGVTMGLNVKFGPNS